MPRTGERMPYDITWREELGMSEPKMSPRLADRLREARDYRLDGEDEYKILTEAAAELDRREALEQAAQAWAKATRLVEQRESEWADRNYIGLGPSWDEVIAAEKALLALFPEAD